MSDITGDRKARLKALKERAAHPTERGSDASVEEGERPASSAPLKFRNYALRDETIPHDKPGQRRVHDSHVPLSVNVEQAIGEQLEDVISNVAPKKPNWDLRREIAGKLARLEKKTQRAIAELAVEEEKKRMADAS